MIRRLLAVECYDEPTEIVIHVNMRKEGRDVTNLYTIVHLLVPHDAALFRRTRHVEPTWCLALGCKVSCRFPRLNRYSIIQLSRLRQVIGLRNGT